MFYTSLMPPTPMGARIFVGKEFIACVSDIGVRQVLSHFRNPVSSADLSVSRSEWGRMASCRLDRSAFRHV